jgi:hypothetical protein
LDRNSTFLDTMQDQWVTESSAQMQKAAIPNRFQPRLQVMKSSLPPIYDSRQQISKQSLIGSTERSKINQNLDIIGLESEFNKLINIDVQSSLMVKKQANQLDFASRLQTKIRNC